MKNTKLEENLTVEDVEASNFSRDKKSGTKPKSAGTKPKSAGTKLKTAGIKPKEVIEKPKTAGIKPKEVIEKPKTAGIKSKEVIEKPKTAGKKTNSAVAKQKKDMKAANVHEKEASAESAHEKASAAGVREMASAETNEVMVKAEEVIETEKSENIIITEDGQKVEFEEHSSLEISKEIVEDKIKTAFEYQTPKRRKRSTIIGLVLLLVNLVFMVFIVKGLIGNIGEVDFSEVLIEQGSKLWWLSGGILVYVVYMLAQTLMYHVLIKDITGKSRWKLSYDVAVVGKYYDNVTPFAVGGQPMQIVRLARSGISAGVSTSIPIIKLMINSMVNIVLVLVFFFFGIPNLPVMSGLNGFLLTLFEILGVIGLIINVLAVVFMLLLSGGNIVSRSLISWVLRVGYRLHLVKNYRESLKKTINQVAEYKSSMKFLAKNKKTLIKMVFLAMLECLSYASMLYFVMMAFMASSDYSFAFLFVCIVKYYICAMASSFIPLPGGTGMMEISFIFLFMELEHTIVFALLAWRFLTYYLILLHGFTHEISRIIRNFIKSKKQKQIFKVK